MRTSASTDAPVEDEAGDSRPSPSDAEDHDSRGQIQAAEWTTSTYRSSRQLKDVPGKASRPARRKPSDTGAKADEEK